MRLELYIADLLFRHDCIIVPTLGAFIGRTKSSEIGSATHLFRPSFKEVGFNSSLTENDGLLAGYVASLNEVSYNSAEAWIASEVHSWNQRLAEGEKLHLSPIGKLYYNSVGKLQFQPSLEQNFSSEAFGLGIFHVPSLPTFSVQPKAVVAEKTVGKPISASQNLDSEKESKTSVSKPFSWKWAAMWLPIAGLLSLGIVGNSFLSDAYKSYSSLGPIVFSKAQHIDSKELQLLPINGLEGMKSKSVVPFGGGVLSSSSIPSDAFTHSDNKTLNAVEESDKSTMPSIASHKKKFIRNSTQSTPIDKEMHLAPATAHRFYIVVGSFGEKINSSKMIEDLKSKGYNSKVAPGTGLSRVSIEDFATRKDAESALKKIRDDVQSGAWVYSPK